MKEETSGPRENGLPPCPLSEQCMLVADELKISSRSHYLLGREDDAQHQQLLAQMQAHLPTCPTCTATLARVSKERDQQRAMLRALLNESEQKVPSTAASIMSVIRNEQRLPQWNHTQHASPDSMNNHHNQYDIPPFSQTIHEQEQQKAVAHPKARRSVAWIRTVFSTVAVAVLLLGSLALFSHFIMFRSSNGGIVFNSGVAGLQKGRNWSSVVMTTVASNNVLTIATYDPLSGKYVELGSTTNPEGTNVDGVSHDGYRLLYHSYDGEKTEYRVAPHVETIYTTQGKAGAAVWSTDDRFIFISTRQGVMQVNVNAANRSAKLIWPLATSPAFPVPDIHFYRSGYLYFSLPTEKGAMGALRRVALNDKTVQTVATCENIHDFWLSPYGATVYYACGDQDTVYAVNSDGSSPRPFRSHVGRLIGFARDNSPITLTTSNNVSRVIELGNNPSQDRVLLNTLTPQALPVMPENVAVAPYGTALVAKSIYPDNTQKLWYGNLLSRQQQLIPVTTGITQVVGWSRLQLTGTTPIAQPTMPLSFSEWHEVLIASSNSQGTTLANDDIHNDSSTALTPATKLPATTFIDGISSDGENVLYHFSSSGHTFYSTIPSVAKTGYFYESNDADAGNALWLPDSHHVLISAGNTGIIRADTQTGEAIVVVPHLKVAQLSFYRAPYLYFIGAEDRAAGALYRVNLNVNSSTPQQVTLRSPHTTFWLSPDGKTVYYVNQGSAGQAGLYAVNSDGSNFATAQPLRTSGVPIGYAGDNALMILRQVQSKFQVLKLGATAQQDQIVLADVAPGAVSLCDTTVAVGIPPICDSSVALAPLGGKLVVEAGYANGNHTIWSIDLATGVRFQLPIPVSLPGEQLKLIGWNQMVTDDN